MRSIAHFLFLCYTILTPDLLFGDICNNDLALGEFPFVQTNDRKKLPLYDLVAHNGEVFDFSKFRGKCVVVSFAYTTCSNPNKCDAVTKQMSELGDLLQKSKLKNEVIQLLISYDARYDTLEKMKAYAEKHGYELNDNNAYYAKPMEYNMVDFFEDMDAKVSFNSSGVSIHDTHAVILDRRGRIAKVYNKILWDNQSVIKTLHSLSDEFSEN